jgi:hypothetical protein
MHEGRLAGPPLPANRLQAAASNQPLPADCLQQTA